MQPAIAYARDGFPVQEIMAAQWQDAAERLAEDAAAARTFLPGGKAPREGEIFANPNLARSLDLIAKEDATPSTPGPSPRPSSPT